MERKEEYVNALTVVDHMKNGLLSQFDWLALAVAYPAVCQSMRLLTAGSLVRVQLGEPKNGVFHF